MRKIFFKSMLLLCALIVGSGSVWGTTYKLTQVTSVADGEKYVFERNGHVLNGTISNNILQTTDEYSTAGLNGTESYIWALETATGGFHIKNVSKGNSSPYLKNNSGTNMSFDGAGSIWVFSFTDGIAIIQNKSNSNRFIGDAGGDTPNNTYKAYATSNLSTYAHDFTVYKLEEEASTFSVTYNANGATTGSVPTDATAYESGATVTILGNSGNLAKSGYSFGGWNTQDDGEGTNYTEGNTFSITSNTTLYAKWNAKVITSLSYTGEPTKNSYNTGDSFDPTGLTVTATFNDASYADVTSDVAWTPDPLTAGTTSVTGTYMGRTVTINGLTTTDVPVSGITLDKTSATLMIGKTLTLLETVLPDNATNKSVTWESDDEDVATVEVGVVTAIAEGTATITAKSVADNTKKATCVITVIDGSIDLRTTGNITFGGPFTGEEIGSGGYKTQNCELNGSDGNEYTWAEVDGYLNSGWQIKKSTGKVTSPVIKSNYGFTISTTKGTNDVIISDGTTSGKNTLTTTKTSTTITIVGDGAYAVFTKISIVPLKAPVATEVAISDPGTLAKDATGTFAYTATTEEDNTASWTSATTSVINITNAATGAYTAAGRGTSKITLTLTPTDATTYEAVSAERIVTVMQPVEITASNVEMTYGDAAEAIGATTSAEYAGTLTYESGNTSIATVDASGNVTAVAAGTTTITISASADASHYYTAGEDVEIEVTVNAPAGRTTAKTTTPVEVTSNTLLSSSLPTGWTGDGEIWSASSSYGAVAANGTIGNSYDLKTPSINLNGNYTAASVTFQHTGKSFSTPSDACKLYVKDGDTETPLTISTMFTGSNWTYVTNTTDLSAYIGKSIQLIFRYAPSSGNQGTWEVKNFVVNATPASTESVTLNADGYATFCSEYPLDFSDYETADYSAWYVTSANTSTGVITFSQIKGTIKGGQGILLKGTPNATITLNSVNSSNELSGNILVGCLAPTYVDQVATYYALVHVDTPEAHSEFQNLGSYTGIIPAGKAYLDLTSLGAAPDRLRIVFEGNNATNIENIEANEKAMKYVENGRILIKKNGITYDTLGRIVK